MMIRMVPYKEVGLAGHQKRNPISQIEGENVVPGSGIVVREVKDELVDWRERGPAVNRPSERC